MPRMDKRTAQLLSVATTARATSRHGPFGEDEEFVIRKLR